MALCCSWRGLATLSHRHGSSEADVPDDSLYCVCCSLIPQPSLWSEVSRFLLPIFFSESAGSIYLPFVI